ncbi:MAG: M48 family metalloprotease [Steroidobacteraceae bacterium]
MATDFFERQRRARAHSLWLRAVFALAMALNAVLIAAGVILMLTFLTLGAVFPRPRGEGGVLVELFARSLVGWYIAGAVLLVCLAVSALTAWELRGGGAALARVLRGTPVPPETSDLAQRQLLNIVAEMAIAARIPEPEVFLLPDEPGINAFAAGRTLQGAVIAVTGGALRELDRDEMQAMVAHEFSHILNGDMALNTRLVAWLAGLYAIESFARALRGSRESKGGAGLLLFWWARLGFYLFHATGAVGLAMGRVLQAAICRRREALADASAVQFTRNPEALKSVLLKVEAAGSIRPRARVAAGMSHMFFASDQVAEGGLLRRLQQGLLETHPRMEDRVRVLVPKLSRAQYRAALRIERRRMLDARAQARAPVPLGGELLAAAATAGERQPVHELLCSRLGVAQQQQVLELQRSIAAAPHAVQALFVAALLDTDTARAKGQLLQLAAVLGAPVTAQVPRMRAALFGLPAIARLQLLVMLLPALGALPDRARLQVVRVMRAFGDKLVPRDTLRFAVSRLALRMLVHAPPQQPAAPSQEATDAAFGLLCSLVAGQSGARAAAAFQAGMNGLVPLLRWPAFTAGDIGAGDVDAALDTVARLPYLQRTRLCDALLRVIGANGSMGVGEFELLRLVSHSVGVATPATGALRLEAVS